jgi:malate dehydrogenase (oxaloacetate-decarboxylating)
MAHHSPSYSITMRLRYPDRPGSLGRITSVIGEADGLIGAVDIVSVAATPVDGNVITRDVTVSATDVEHGERIVECVRGIEGVTVVHVSDRTFLLHLGGKIEVHSKVPVKTRDDLSMAYTPGVARVCRAIHADRDASFALTIRRNTVAVITDGSAVLGLGNIGPEAALPVMEGKALLFKEFGGVDAFPICLATQNVDRIVDTCTFLAPTFGGINLEDISSPRCIEIEERLSEQLEIPVFHDDQHGTAIVVMAALKNALRVVGKQPQSIRVTINGAGAAGIAIARLLLTQGVSRIVLCDRTGPIYRGRAENMNASKVWLAENTNPDRVNGSLSDAVAGVDVFIGVSGPNVLDARDLERMAHDPIVFALANPDPEIAPESAQGRVAVMATGRSDYPNQINNVLCFPGFFRGLLDARACKVVPEMKLAAAEAIASVISESELHPSYIIPSVFDRRVATAVAAAVAQAATESGVARRQQKQGTQGAPA